MEKKVVDVKVPQVEAFRARLAESSHEDIIAEITVQQDIHLALVEGTTPHHRSQREVELYATCVRMAEDQRRHDAEADALLADALSGSEWLLEINDGEVED